MSAKKNAAGTTAREDGLGSRELATIGETATTAAAAQATAAVQARYLMAARFPRDPDQSRVTLLAECKRPTFAEGATYTLQFGSQRITGPSIRLAEAAVRALRNILVETSTIYDDAEKRVLRVTVSDLEANVPYSQEIVLSKLVERRELRKGQVALSQRTNAAGLTVYTVEASESDFGAKQGAAVSKVLRTLALRLVPGDLLEEALEACAATLANKDREDPDAQRKKIADAFAGIGVQPASLREFLGHELGSCSPVELRELRGVFTAIRDGATTWNEALGERKANAAAPPAPAPTTSPGAPAAQAAGKVPEPAKSKTVAELKAEAIAKTKKAPETPAVKP